MPDPRRHLASDLGCILDCDLNTGLTSDGRPATDNTALLNAFLATASATTPVYLVLDGPTLITGLLLNGGHTTIEGTGPDTGFFLKAGSNAHAIRNHQDPQAGDPGSGHPAPPRTNFGITVRNLRLNGNRGNGTDGNTDHGITYDVSGKTMLYGISLVGASAIWLEDLILHETTTYAVCLSNCSAVVCRNIRITTHSGDRNTDGIHINGPASDIHISDSFFQTSDDPIALNAPEGFGGPITRVAVSNCVFDRCPTALRIYGHGNSSVSFPISSVLVSNCTGTVTNCPVLIGFQHGSPVDNLQDFQISNCSFQANFWATINESCGVLTFANQTWDSPTRTGQFLWIPLPATVSSLTLASCRIYRSTRGSAPASGLFAAAEARGSVIRKLTLDGFSIENEAGQTFPPIPLLLDTENVTVEELFITALDSANIAALVKPALNFRGIGRISGPGVLATGFLLPEGIMADDTPFLNASGSHAGSPCIKLNGKVKKL